jgi:CSLREA domain-containing protein
MKCIGFPILSARSPLKLLVCALSTILALLALPAFGAAATFHVDTTVDTETILETPCVEGHQCTLRDAILLADSTAGADTIDFAGIPAESVLEIDEAPLPDINEGVTIDGFLTAAGTSAAPAVELVPLDQTLEYPPGLTVSGSAGTRIEGLALGGWGSAIVIEPTEGESAVETKVCGNYVGVKMDGFETRPNVTGVEIGGGPSGEGSEDVWVGFPGFACAGNVISGNESVGIEDGGFRTAIAGNRIGIGPEAAQGPRMPNGTGGAGSAGVLELAAASGTIVGGTTAGAGETNLIYFNKGPGVKVESAGSGVSIRRDSIFENEGLGIELSGGGPAAPHLDKAELTSTDELSVEGSVEAGEEETVELEFFGNPACELGGTGQGLTVLGEHSIAVVPGINTYSFTLPVNPPVDESGFTATATRGGDLGATSQFSACLSAEFERTFTVNTLDDTRHGGECTAVCSLRDAIALADLSDARDTIDFGVAGVIGVEPEPLPPIDEPVLIDGTTAPGYAGTPRVLIDGRNAFTEGETEGLVVDPDGGGSVIKGVALGGFGYGIYLNGTAGSQLCSSWVGVGLDGTTPLPDGIGVETGSGSSGNQIGGGCGVEGGDVIVAGREWGVRDFGQETTIAAGRIGIGAAGEPLPNGTNLDGGGGIDESESSDALIAGNTIAYNLGPGVSVDGASRVQIRGNSIFANKGGGIALSADPAPVPPLVESVEGSATAVTVEGFLTTPAEETVELDFFANASCDPSGAGQGQTYLGSRTVTTPIGGEGSFAAVLPTQVPAGQDLITATATGQTTGQTSEFSRCFEYEPPPPVEPEEPESRHEETKAPGQSPPPAASASAVTIVPVNGEKVVVAPVAGKVRIKLRGTNRYVPLEELKEIPVGAVIDATKGKVHLTSIGPDGTEQSADFFGGVFRVKQRTGAGLVVLELLDTGVCPAPGAARRALGSSLAARPAGGGTKGKLWGSGHGSFRTEGNDGSATVRGTIWLVEDRCDGTTFFRTRRGIVSVRDFILHKTLPLPAGKRYVAGEG